MRVKAMMARFWKDENGASAIEFVILAPVLIMALLGVMQVGLYMQAQNALSGVAGDMSRFMAIEYQRENEITNSQLETLAYSRAVSSPYLLQSSRISTKAQDASTQSIANVREIELTLNYQVPGVMAFASFGDMKLSYTRSIYVARVT